MKKVAIIGCGGAGKTYLANRLADLGFPVTHLDSLYYTKTWNAIAPCEFASKQRSLVAGDNWLIEGNYASTLEIRVERADTVIFLDIHPIVCLVGILQRRLRYGGGQHVEEGIYDRFSLSFILYILGYRRRMRPRLYSLLERCGTGVDLIVLRSRRQVTEFVTKIGSRNF